MFLADNTKFLIISLIAFSLSGCVSQNGMESGVNEDKAHIKRTLITAEVIEDATEELNYKGYSEDVKYNEHIDYNENEGIEHNEANKSVEPVKQNELQNEPAQENQSLCIEGWKCVETKYRAYQKSDCSWASAERCDYRCQNNTCVSLHDGAVCIPDSLRCYDKILKKCSQNGSQWLDFEICGYDCRNNKCAKEDEIKPQETNTIPENSNGGGTCGDGCIAVTLLHSDAEGNDCTNLNDEYIKFKNKCPFSCYAVNWTVTDKSGKKHYTFQNFRFEPDADVTLYTGCGANTSAELHWCSHGSPCNAIWNNDGDTLYLRNHLGKLMVNYTY